MNEIEENARQLICESCGKEFSCGANVGKCWCFDVEVKPKTLTKLREDFNNCLCADCLAKFSKEKNIYGKYGK